LKDLSVIILAAGLGTRMKSGLVKVMHPLLGRPMILWTLENVLGLKPEKTVVVLGHQAGTVKAVLPRGVEVAMQKKQLGTADAVKAGLGGLKGFQGTVMVVSGDTPLLEKDTLRKVVSSHRRTKSDATVLTAVLDDPTGYGRIIRDGSGRVARITEEKDADRPAKALREINAGTYCFETKRLRKALGGVGSNNAQGEFYLTDVVSLTNAQGGKVGAVTADLPQDALGINSRVELAEAERVLRGRINRRHMLAGVSISDPETTYIGPGVIIGRDTVIHPGNHITGNSVIGKGCTLMPGNVIHDSTVKDRVLIKGYSVLNESCVDDDAQVGPFAHLRTGSRLERCGRLGNFVETKAALIGEGSKASHLSYLGDAVIGRDVNIGAGTITCNYDGTHKHKTVIGDRVFVGSDTQFIAPVCVGPGSVVAAGTTVTQDVPEDSLVISRTKQAVREGWVKKRRKPGTSGKKKK